METWKFYLKDSFCLILLTLVSLLYFWPLLKNPAALTPFGNEPVYAAWKIKTLGDNLIQRRLPLLDGPMLYPYQYSLAFSDPLLTPTLITLPLRFFTNEPLVLFNTALLISHVLMVTFLFFVLHELTDNRTISLIASLLFGFSWLHLLFIPHFPSYSLEWVLLSWLALIKLSRIPSKPWFYLYCLSLVTQLATACMSVYFILFITTAFLFRPQFRKHITLIRHAAITATGITLLLMLPLLFVFVKVHLTYEFYWPITTIIHQAISLEEIFSRFFSPGLFFFGIAGMAALTQKLPTKTDLFYWLLALFSWLLCLGPALKILGETVKLPLHVPLPYFFLYYLVPGFPSLSSPVPWIMLSALFFTTGAAIVWKRWPDTMRALLLVGCAILFSLNWSCIPVTEVPSQADYPLIYYALKEKPPGLTLELPLYPPHSYEAAKEESKRLLFQTYHQQSLINGWADNIPPEYETVAYRLNQNAPISWENISALTIQYVIVHEDEYTLWPQQLPPGWENDALQKGFKEIGRFDKAILLERLNP